MDDIDATIATLSPEKRQLLERLLQEGGVTLSQLTISAQKRVPGAFLPLSFAQQRMWFLNQLDPDSAVYNMPAAVRIRGELYVPALEQALNTIVARHEILRTTFPTVEGLPAQAIAPSMQVPLQTIDLRSFPQIEREERARQLILEVGREPFLLARGPLLRARVFCIDEQEYILLLVTHHIISDGWSQHVLVQELTALYAAFSTGKPSSLSQLPVQYADFARWQQQWMQGTLLDTELAYWQQHLHGSPALLKLPTDHPRPAIQRFRGKRQSLVLPRTLMLALNSLSEAEDVTLFMTLFAAFQVLLYRYTGQEDLIVGTPIANRNRSETEGLIGFFVNTLLLRTNVAGNPTFRDLMRQVREVALEAYAHQDLPFEKLVERLEPERSLSYAPLFQVAFILENVPSQALDLPGLVVTPMEIASGTAKFDLTLNMEETDKGLIATLEYNSDLFEPATATRLLGHFQTLLESIVTQPEVRLADLALLTTAEYRQLVVGWNEMWKVETDIRCAHTLFEDQVQQTPSAVAVTIEGEQLTYQQLNQRANRLAYSLMRSGVGPEVIVGLCMEPSLEMIIGLLGILKAGGAYIPLDPSCPQERLAFMLANAHVTTIVTQVHLAARLEAQNVHVLCLDTGLDTAGNDFGEEHDENPVSGVTGDNIAYVIHTSGSTGVPKGVLVQQSGLSNLVAAQARLFEIGPGHQVLQFATFSFDASVWDIFMTLTRGATLHLARQKSMLPGRALCELLREQAITMVTLPPSALATLSVEELPALQIVISAGEACPARLVEAWAPGHRFFNAYGPTEVTVCATIAECVDGDQAPSIGHPIANTQIYLLDRHWNPVPIGVVGELYVGGAGLARGYLQRPDLTADRFLPNPFGSEPGMRMYRTGDYARYLPDGTIEYLNRVDQQVKVRGFRIELEEIESALGQHPDVHEVAIVAREAIPGDMRIVAYVVPARFVVSAQATRSEPLEKILSMYLRRSLPEYMIPAHFILLEGLPLLPNGKVDRQALPAPDRTNAACQESFVAPRTPLELRVTQIWEALLHIHPIGVMDNFFELGGHSLLAAHLIARMEKEFKQRLSLNVLFQAGTVEAVAHVLVQGGDTPAWSPLVPLQTVGSKPPFFIVHPAPGTAFCYLDLARHLGQDQPVYGLQAQGLDGEMEPLWQVKDMAASYISALRTIQPAGPYRLGGHSFGGIVAFEMAQQLHAQGDTIALLTILDCIPPIFSTPGTEMKVEVEVETDEVEDLIGLAMVMGQFFGKNPSISSLQVQHVPVEERVGYLLRWLQSVNILPPDAEEAVIQGLLRVHHANSQAYNTYKPTMYPERITLFRAQEVHAVDYGKAPASYLYNPTFGWETLSSQSIDVHTVPGNHVSMLTEPFVQPLAEQLRQCLDEAAVSIDKRRRNP